MFFSIAIGVTSPRLAACDGKHGAVGSACCIDGLVS